MRVHARVNFGCHSIIADNQVSEFWLCSRAMGDTGSAVTCYEESAEFLSKILANDLEVIPEILVSYSKFPLHL